MSQPKTAEVVSIDQLRYQRDTKALAPHRTRMDFDFKDVTRHSSGPKHVDSLDDPIRLTAQGEMDIRRIFWAYGLRQVPQTWGQLVGNLTYCKVVQLWLLPFTRNEPEYIQLGFLDIYEKEEPGRGQMVQMLAEGNLDGVAAWHKQQGTFESNGRSSYWCKEKPR